MKPSVLISAIVLALVVSSQTFAQAPRPSTPQDVRAEFETMKRDIARLNKDLGELKAAKGPTLDQFNQVLDYLYAQADGAADMKAVLLESEEKGFTYGINPDSRIVLLAGFERLLTARETDLPGGPQGDAQANE